MPNPSSFGPGGTVPFQNTQQNSPQQQPFGQQFLGSSRPTTGEGNPSQLVDDPFGAALGDLMGFFGNDVLGLNRGQSVTGFGGDARPGDFFFDIAEGAIGSLFPNRVPELSDASAGSRAGDVPIDQAFEQGGITDEFIVNQGMNPNTVRDFFSRMDPRIRAGFLADMQQIDFRNEFNRANFDNFMGLQQQALQSRANLGGIAV